MPSPVRVRLFASARVAVGRPVLPWPVAEGGVTARELLAELGAAYPRLRSTLRVCRYLRNDRYLTGLDELLRPGDELAIHPPYGGG
jgi:molybdopterin converting factor small subunit